MSDFARINQGVFPGSMILRATRTNPYRFMVDLHLDVQHEDRFTVAQPLTMAPEVKEGAYFAPFLSLDQNTAQRLMDELWNCGLRPSEGSGSAGAMAAVQAHLADMRALCFRPLGGVVPPFTSHK